MKNYKRDELTPDRMVNGTVALAEALMDSSDEAQQTQLLGMLSDQAEKTLARLNSYRSDQEQCPDYFLFAEATPKFMLDRMRNFAHCAERSLGIKHGTARKRRPVIAIPESEGPAREACLIMAELEESVARFNSTVSKPSAEAFAALYTRMDMVANMEDRIHADILDERDRWFARFAKGRPAKSKLENRRAEIRREIGEKGYAALGELLDENYGSPDELHTAAARCYYTCYMDDASCSLADFMDCFYRYEAYMDFGDREGGEGRAMPKTEDCPAGLYDMVRLVEEDESLLQDGYTAESFRHYFAAVLRNPDCLGFLTSGMGARHEGLNMAAFCNVVGLLLSHGFFDASQTQLAEFFLSEWQCEPGMIKPESARKYIGAGMQFDDPELAVIRTTLESGFKLIKKSV